MGPAEFAIILAAILILFGGKRLPQLGEAMGKTIRNFRKSVNKDFEEIDDNGDTKAIDG